jgi:Zn-dependent protease with chaperone function
LQEGLLMVFVLYVAALVFVERAQFEAPSADPSGKDKAIPVLWKIGARDLASGLLWFLLMGLTLLKEIVLAPVAGAHAAFEVIALLALLVAVGAIRSGAQPDNLRAVLLSRGALLNGITGVARKAGCFESAEPSVYVLEEMSQALPSAPPTAAVVAPRQLLDTMSRREINALAAWQLCRQSKQCHARPLRRLLVWDAVAVCLLECLVPSPVIRCATLLPLLAVQIAALAKYLPHARLEADLRAAKLTGDAEVFLSAVAGLFRFRGVPIPEASARPIARRSGIPSGRIPEILVERIAPVEDRYPTTGSYIETGL